MNWFFTMLIALVIALVATCRVEAQQSLFDTSDVADTSSLFDTSDDVEVQIAQIENRLGEIRQRIEEITEFVSAGSQFDTSELVPVQAPEKKSTPIQTVSQSPVQKLAPVQYTYFRSSSGDDNYAGLFGRGRRVERRQMRREGRGGGGLFGLRGGC